MHLVILDPCLTPTKAIPRVKPGAHNKMKCPFCSTDNDRVLDTRVQKDGGIRRRRECISCKGRFSTLETLSLAYPMIIKKDGRREPYSKEKILRGLQAACQKRPVSLAQIENVVEKISQWVLSRSESEISARIMGKKVMSEIKQLDDVAYVRFASVYRTFKDVQEFVDSLEDAELLDMQNTDSPQLTLTSYQLDFEKGKPNEPEPSPSVT